MAANNTTCNPDLAGASLGGAPAVAVVLAVIFHVMIQSVEFEGFMWHFLGGTALSWPIFIGLYNTVGNLRLIDAILRTTLIQTAFQGTLLICIAIYRTLLHRCRKFPGPFWARLSKWYALSLAAKDVQYHKEVEKMHLKYGDVVRTGPREIMVLRKSALDLLYGPKSSCTKTTWYAQSSLDPDKSSLHLTRNPEGHRKRRRAWDKALAVRALDSYQPRIKAAVDALVVQLAERGHSIDITKWSVLFSFDLIGQIGFGKDFGQLKTGEEHSAIAPFHGHIKTLGIFQMMPWLLYLLSCMTGATSQYSELFSFCANEIRDKKQIREQELKPDDIASWLLKAFEDGMVTAAPTREALDDDSRLLLLAGSDTISSTLSQCLYQLVNHPHEQKKLHTLLDAKMPQGSRDWSFSKVQAISQIDDFISETMRTRPTIMLSGPRETPSSGLHIDEVYIPPGVNVQVPIGQLQQDPRYWAQADEFIPERWGDLRQEMGTDESPYMPFSLGAYSCPGRHLARMVVGAALSMILLKYHISFAVSEDGKNFEEEVLDNFVVTLPPLKLCFSPRAAQ